MLDDYSIRCMNFLQQFGGLKFPSSSKRRTCPGQLILPLLRKNAFFVNILRRIPHLGQLFYVLTTQLRQRGIVSVRMLILGESTVYSEVISRYFKCQRILSYLYTEDAVLTTPTIKVPRSLSKLRFNKNRSVALQVVCFKIQSIHVSYSILNLRKFSLYNLKKL